MIRTATAIAATLITITAGPITLSTADLPNMPTLPGQPAPNIQPDTTPPASAFAVAVIRQTEQHLRQLATTPAVDTPTACNTQTRHTDITTALDILATDTRHAGHAADWWTDYLDGLTRCAGLDLWTANDPFTDAGRHLTDLETLANQ